MAIRNFRHKGLEELFIAGRSGKVGARFARPARLLLDLLDGVHDLRDCVGVRGFHALSGDRKGFYAFKVSANYRLTFTWRDGEVCDVDLEDYH
jgi:toxin HigB-1